ncbi:histidine kinase [Oleidesulfovibrio sp.]|uniref:histidine kinase n=1 Tax=Oleidesulfovibrio sp. TaxID=2909707 RepID=UPI003A86D131
MSNETPFSQANLKARLRNLEEQARFTLDVLEMASNLGDFQTSINKLHEPSSLLREAMERVGELVRFSAMAFYLVDESSSDFSVALCQPEEFRSVVDDELEHLIDTGVFALALRENRPITVYSRDNQHRLVLQALATSSRTRGMFVGAMPRSERNLSGILLSLLSITLKHCANAIESFELYRLFRENEARQRAKLDQLPVSIVDATLDGQLISATGALVRQFALNPSTQISSLRLHDLLQPESKQELQEAIDTLQQHTRQLPLPDTQLRLTARGRKQNGDGFPAVLHITLRSDASGPFIRAIFA